jgi:hypothetical protein
MHTCQNYTRVCGNHALRVKPYSAGGKCTLRVEISIVLVEITLVRVLITFMPVKYTLRVKITLFRVETTLCVLKSHFGC